MTHEIALAVLAVSSACMFAGGLIGLWLVERREQESAWLSAVIAVRLARVSA